METYCDVNVYDLSTFWKSYSSFVQIHNEKPAAVSLKLLVSIMDY